MRLDTIKFCNVINESSIVLQKMHYGPEQKKKHRKDSHLVTHFPTSEGVSKVSERANE